MEEDEILERIGRDARLLRLPLVRMGDRLTAGPAEPEWRAWLSES
jgi:arsenate reductase-like glutaredoxin family protein